MRADLSLPLGPLGLLFLAGVNALTLQTSTASSSRLRAARRQLEQAAQLPVQLDPAHRRMRRVAVQVGLGIEAGDESAEHPRLAAARFVLVSFVSSLALNREKGQFGRFIRRHPAASFQKERSPLVWVS